MASTRQHHHILRAHVGSGILPWPQGKQHHAFQSHEQHHFSWPARGSTTISCRLMTAPVYCPGLKASSTMPSSLTSSTTSHGQHAAAPPYPAGSCWLRYIALASIQVAPCLPVSRAAPLLVASTRQHHNILQAHDSSGILPWPQGKQHHPSSLTSSTTSHGQHAAAPPYPAGSCWLRYIALASIQVAPCLPVSRAAPLFVASTRQHHHILQAHDSSFILPGSQGKQHHAFQSHEQHHFSWPAHGSTTISWGLMLAPVYCPGLKASSTILPVSRAAPLLMNSTDSSRILPWAQGKQHHAFQSHEQHHFSWPAHGSTTISYGLMLAPSYCPGLKASSTMPSSLTSSTTSRGQHTAAPPYPTGSCWLRYIARASRQAAPSFQSHEQHHFS
uniref:Uncharacterized protein n=1 Tax=Haemonchus contortus TaxID=6289 RepID=A0A7I4YGB8_HAECO